MLYLLVSRGVEVPSTMASRMLGSDWKAVQVVWNLGASFLQCTHPVLIVIV
jgi:hypothetical protein